MTMANEFVHAFQDVTPHDELLEAEGLILQAEACLQHDAFSRVPAIVTAAGKILARLDTRRQPNQTGSVAYLETLTGASELAAGQLDSAEQHLRRGYDQLSSQRGEFLPPELRYRLLQTATWLADLYAKWERPDQAEVWRKTADELAH